MEQESKTLQRILESGKKEFLEKGYQAASLRNIVKSAGVTTGAFYGYYSSKEALFEALVSEQYDYIMKLYMETKESFKKLDAQTQQSHMGEISGECLEQMLEYMYANEEVFLLLLTCSKGTRFENMVSEMCEVEVQATHDFIQAMKQDGKEIRKIDPMLEHILTSGMFAAFFELVIHKNEISEARTYLRQMRAFYTAGWARLFDM